MITNPDALSSSLSSRGAPGRFAARRRLPARLWSIPSGRAGLSLAAVLLATVLFGPGLVPYDPNAMDLPGKLSAPNTKHWLGTDNFGRDQLARILEGGRRSLGAALLVMVSVLAIGVSVGITAGMCGGIVDVMLMRLVDMLLALPSTVLALAVVGALGVGFQNLLLAIVASGWAYYARLSRSYVIAARQRQDVIVARLAGIGWPRIVLGHIVPGVFAQLFILATLDLGGIIIGIAGLSFLGLGVQPPTAEWGAMLSESRLYFSAATWLLGGPTAAILLAVAAANFIGNALRDAADPGGLR